MTISFLRASSGRREVSSNAPSMATPRDSTVQSSGTLISIPPHHADALRIASSDSIEALRRSISLEPMTADTLPPRKSWALMPRWTLPRRLEASSTRLGSTSGGGAAGRGARTARQTITAPTIR